MKRATTLTKAIFLLSVLFYCVTSCRKEDFSKNDDQLASSSSAHHGPVTRAYRDSFVNKLQFIPDIANGWTPPNPAPAWFPGDGTGHVTHMGNAKMFFNQYANESGLVAAPVSMFFSPQLSGAGFANIPSSISTIIFDGEGNSIWFHHTSINVTVVSPTQATVLGTQDIVGGTGKFIEASGQVTLHASFNPQNLLESSSWQDGWIRY